MLVTERCNGCRKTGGWHGEIGPGKAPVFHHVFAARRKAMPAVKAAEFRLANAKANRAAGIVSIERQLERGEAAA